jgi:membrane fusion protein, multidrug efflux system
MVKRIILALVIMTAAIAGLGFVKYRQIKAVMAVYASYEPPPEAVTTVIAREERWPSTISAIATAAAVRGVTISADLPGTIDTIAFDSGQRVREGDVLVQLDTRQEQAQLAAAQAQRDLSRANLDRLRDLRDQRVVSQAEYDQAEAAYKQAVASEGEIRATIGRKTVRAPFSGELGLRQVNLGQYLAPGTPIVSLQALKPVYVNFAVPQQQVAALRVGTAVRARIDDEDVGMGRVTAVDSVVDPATRNAQIQATFANANGRLHPGMFVQAEAVVGGGTTVVVLPASAINHAPYGDSVFVVENTQGPKGMYRAAHQRFVKLGSARGDQVAVLSGVKSGDEVATSGLFKLRNNVAVLVNNSIQPSNSATPEVEDR